MKKIIILSLLSLFVFNQMQGQNCPFTYTLNGNTANFTHNIATTTLTIVDSLVYNYGDASPLTNVGVVLTSAHTYPGPGTYNTCHTWYMHNLNSTTTFTCSYCDSITIGGTASCAVSVNAVAAGSTITATATASGGTAPYTYSYTLNPGSITNSSGVFTGLSTGGYSVCVTAFDAMQNQCSIGCDSAFVSNTFFCTTTINSTASGNTVTSVATASGGSAPYTYSYNLNPGNITNSTGIFTGLANGAYTICATATDAQNNACVTACDSTFLGTTGPCTTSIQTITNGSTAIATGSATGGAMPYTYSYTLNPGSITNTTGVFTGLANGGYSICATATDAQNNICSIACDSVLIGSNTFGCSVNASFSEVISGLSVNFTNNSSITNGTITNYGWDFGDGNQSTTASPSHSYTSANTYTVTLVVTGYDSLQVPCIDSSSKTITVGPSSINNVNAQNLNIYPNPTSKAITIELPVNEKIVNLIMTDVSGRTIESKYNDLSNGKLSVNLKNEASGLYFIKLQTNRSIYTSSFMKQ